MAYPVVASTSSGFSTAAASSHTLTYPSGIASGDLLLLLITAEDDANLVYGGFDGWTAVEQASTATLGLVLYSKVAGSALSGNFTFNDTSGNVQVAWICQRITGSDTASLIAYSFYGSSANPDPPSLDSLDSVAEKLWIACCSWLDDISVSAYPTSYGSNQATTRYADASGVGIATATRNATNAIEDPATFTISASNDHLVLTACVFPLDEPSGSGPAALTLGADGVGYKEPSGSGPALITLDATGTGYKEPSGSGPASITLSATGVGESATEGSGPALITIGASGVGHRALSGSGPALITLGAEGVGVAGESSSGSGTAALTIDSSGTGYKEPVGVGIAPLFVTAYSIGEAGLMPGGPRRCCCTGCLISEDDFNRADSDSLGSKWIEKTGDWDIFSNTLVSTTDGVVLTTARQSKPRNTTYNYRVEVDLLDTASTWSLICKYTDASTYDWIELTNNSGVVLPRFWRRVGGVDKLIMDITTHPAGTPLTTAMPASLTVTFCYSEVEWSIFSVTPLGTQLWTTCDVNAPTTFPSDVTVGFVGFAAGDFDNWKYYYHYLSLRVCDGCDCSCVNPLDETDYKCVPECLLLTLSPIVIDTDCTASPGDLTMKMRQSTPIANDPPPPTYVKNATKKYWYSDPVIFYEPLYYSGDEHFWFRLECLSPGLFEIVALDYRAFDTTISGNRANFQTLDGPNAGTLSVSVVCNPIVMTFARFIKFTRQFTTGGPFLCDPLSAKEYTTTITECPEESPMIADFRWTINDLIEDFIT